MKHIPCKAVQCSRTPILPLRVQRMLGWLQHSIKTQEQLAVFIGIFRCRQTLSGHRFILSCL